MTIDPLALQNALQSIFPDATIDDRVVAAAQAVLDAGHGTVAAAAAGLADPFVYYMGDATHWRSIGCTSGFTGHLPLVRVPLPATGSITDVPDIVTGLGVLIPNDRKIASVEQMPNFTDEPVARADLLTPPRAPGANGGRFGAVAVYLCYATADAACPTSYILEAGTATGQPHVIFPSKGMADIVNLQSGYEPTPFSNPTNFYCGRLTMSGDEPTELMVTSQNNSGTGPGAGASPYIRVTIRYTRLPGPPSYDPIALLIEAAARVGKIGRAMGVDPGIAPQIAALLDGWNLSWLHAPDAS